MALRIDPHLPSMPVVYASEAFLKLTGYARLEVLGHRHRFLSGPDVDLSTMLQIHECIQNGKACKARFPDYRYHISSRFIGRKIW